jgi:signal transduction histidine kinase
MNDDERTRGGVSGEPARRRVSRLSLRVFAVLFVANLVVFSGLGAFIGNRVERQREEVVLRATEQIVDTLQTTIRPGGELNVARILAWPGWAHVADALLVDANLERTPSGRVWPRGVALHPVGQTRSLGARDELLEALARALATGTKSAFGRGLVVPIAVEDRTWGALWFEPREDPTGSDLTRLLWSGFALSTVLLLVGTYAALHPLVLEPVQRLARAATRLSGGDLTTRVAAGERNDEISALLRSFNAMAQRVEALSKNLEREVEEALAAARRAERAVVVEQRLAAMGRLAAGIAHEINNPLGGLVNAVQALRGGKIDDARRARYLELLASGLERIGTTVGQVLRMAPRETGAQRVDLVLVVRDACGLVRHRVEQQSARLEFTVGGERFDAFDPPPSAPGRFTVVGARAELAQALLNLLFNALDALEERPGAAKIAIALVESGDEVELSVSDDGPGVDPANLERLVDLFFTTKEVGRGTGLGLAIVHNVVDSHGGRLVLANAPSGGFVATCTFPRATL